MRYCFQEVFFLGDIFPVDIFLDLFFFSLPICSFMLFILETVVKMCKY